MKKLIILFIFIYTIQPVFAQPQIPPALQKRLENKSKVRDIMVVVDDYYQNGKANIDTSDLEANWEGNAYEWWLKWAYWAKKRMLPDGTLADYKTLNYNARIATEIKYNALLRNAENQLNTTKTWADEKLGSTGTSGAQTFGNWTSIGPFDGGKIVNSASDINGIARMDRIVFHPTDPNIMYTGSPSGGLYKTTNGGSSWFQIGLGLPKGVACMAISRTNGNVLYVYTGDGDSHFNGTFVVRYRVSPNHGGIFKSTDGGNSFTACANILFTPTPLDFAGRQMVVSDANSNIVMVATSFGVFKSTDGGASWAIVLAGNYYDVKFKPYNDAIVYASTDTAIQVSFASGVAGTWITSALLTPYSTKPNRINLAVQRNNTGNSTPYVYAILGAAYAGGFAGLYKSSDGGITYSLQTNTPNILGGDTSGTGSGDQSQYDMGICIKPTDFNYVITAGLAIWRSNGSNGGTSMKYSSTYREGNGALNKYVHGDVHDVQYNPINNYLYAACDGGVYRSTDDGLTWSNLSTGLVASQFYHMRMKDADGDGDMDGSEILGFAQDNGIKFRTDSGDWRHVYCCDGYDGLIKGSNGKSIVFNINNNYYTSPDGGKTISFKGSPAYFLPMAIDYDFDDTMYLSGTSIFRSYDGFATRTTLSGQTSNFITTCPSNNTRLYGSNSSDTTLYSSSNNGTSWTLISMKPGWPVSNSIVTDCKASFTNSNEIYVSFAGYTSGVKVFFSTDAGNTWYNYSGSLPNIPVHSICPAPEGVYAGTETGVYFRATGAADWIPFFTGMPNLIVTDLWVHENGLVYASTFGGGIWVSARNTCLDVLSITGILDDDHYYESNITSNVAALADAGSSQSYSVLSNGSVYLKPGFEVKNGTNFIGRIAPCTNNGNGPSLISKNYAGPDISHIIEYDTKDQIKHRRATTAYFVKTTDGGIEINMPTDAILQVAATNALTTDTLVLVKKVSLSAGMYKITSPLGYSQYKVWSNDQLLEELEMDERKK